MIWCYFSELAFYNDIDRQLTGLLQAVNRGANSRVIIESSANGMNSFYDLCMNAEKGQSRFKLFFLGFQNELYLQQWKSEMDEGEALFKSQNNGKKMTPKDFDDAEKVLYEKYDTHIRSLMWRRMKLLDMELSSFQQEFPSNLYEAFVNSSGNLLFSQTKILERMDHLTPSMTKGELEGEIPDSLLQYIGRGLEIYHTPEAEKYYFSGVDVASGSSGNSDDSTMSVIDDTGQQVMSFYTNKLSPHKFAQVIYDLGMWFGYSYMAVERNGGYGSVCLQILKEQLFYENLYKGRHFDEKGKSRLKSGFLTTESSKKIAVSLFRNAFEVGEININCRSTLNQMTIFQEKNGKLNARRGKNNKDDLIVSFFLACTAKAEGKWHV